MAILSGEGGSFCVGADLKEMEIGKWTLRQSLLFGEKPIGPSNYKVWKPIIAAVHGHVNGGGLWLALECDMRICCKNALFGAGETRVNLPALIGPFLLDHLPGCTIAELLFTGKQLDAQRAYQLGLVNEVVSEDQLMSRAIRVAEEICERGPLSIWASKEMILRSRHMRYKGILSMIERLAPPVWNSEDTVEGKRAFLEKRKPHWKLR